jgi:hypothetical protein
MTYDINPYNVACILWIDFSKPLELKPHVIPGETSALRRRNTCRRVAVESVHAPRSDSGSCFHVIMNHLETTPCNLPAAGEDHSTVCPLVKFLCQKEVCLCVVVYYLQVCIVLFCNVLPCIETLPTRCSST